MDEQPISRTVDTGARFDEPEGDEIERALLLERLKRDPRVVAQVELRIREVLARKRRETSYG